MTGIEFIDQDGNPMTLHEWATRYQDSESRVVARDPVVTKYGPAILLTVWHGLFDHGHINVFETALCYTGGGISEVEGYRTRDAALAGHRRHLASYGSAGPPSGYTCPRCGRTSHHPTDIREGYCGACHDWTAREG